MDEDKFQIFDRYTLESYQLFEPCNLYTKHRYNPVKRTMHQLLPVRHVEHKVEM